MLKKWCSWVCFMKTFSREVANYKKVGTYVCIVFKIKIAVNICLADSHVFEGFPAKGPRSQKWHVKTMAVIIEFSIWNSTLRSLLRKENVLFTSCQKWVLWWYSLNNSPVKIDKSCELFLFVCFRTLVLMHTYFKKKKLFFVEDPFAWVMKLLLFFFFSN